MHTYIYTYIHTYIHTYLHIHTYNLITNITVDYSVTQRSFAWPLKHNLPFFFCSASDGTNVVKVGYN